MYNHNVSKIYIYNRFFFHLNMNRLSKFEELNCIFRAQSSYKHCDRWNCWNSHLIDHFGYCNFHQEVRNILDYEFPNRNSIISQTTSPQATVWSPHNSLFQTREDHTSCTYWSWFATMGIKTIWLFILKIQNIPRIKVIYSFVISEGRQGTLNQNQMQVHSILSRNQNNPSMTKLIQKMTTTIYMSTKTPTLLVMWICMT